MREQLHQSKIAARRRGSARFTRLALLLSMTLAALIAPASLSPALADKTNPDFVPPEITLPMAGVPSPMQTPAVQRQPSGQVGAAGQAGAAGTPGQGGYPGFQMPANMPPGLGGMNPFLMKGADRLRQAPGTHFNSRGMQDPALNGAPPAGSSAYGGPPPVTQGMPYPAGTGPNAGQAGQGAALSTSAKIADPTAVIQTNKGNITIMLFRQYAPNTVNAFLDMVHQGFYNNKIWHRVEPGFVIQGGCPIGNGTGLYPNNSQPRYLPLETSPNCKHNAAGVVAMAHLPGNVNSASCQFYITLSPQPRLDNQYTVFGGVTSGMEVVRSITKGDQIISVSVSE